MDKKLQQGLDWLNKEMTKDEKDIQNHKMKMIDEIKKFDRSELIPKPTPKQKLTLIKKLAQIFGYGKKG